ncbi:alcohol dehydrogenase [Thozetella sp. PMI_491]|nr:alcohol dehydrogenase [Thozetella sp. PMI_491]
MTLPQTTDEWALVSASKDEFLLSLRKSVPVPPVGPDEVLVEVRAVSLNYRDLAIARGRYPLPIICPLVPASDASGIVLAVGSSVTSLSVGNAVCVLPAPLLVSGHLTSATHAAPGDGNMPGTLRRHMVVPASWLVRFPDYLSFAEGCTLGAAGVSAWNALFGYGPQSVKKGDWVVTQGTGAVALFAAAFAVHTGATVISTTSSAAKFHWLKELGVKRVLNYHEDPTWGETARKLTPDGEGVDLVVDVGGAGTLRQSLKAIRYDGVVAVAGFLSDEPEGPAIMEVLPRAAVVRGILAGSRVQYEEMVSAMEKWQFHPVIDQRTFEFEEAKEAYEYLWSQKHVGKVVIKIDK